MCAQKCTDKNIQETQEDKITVASLSNLFSMFQFQTLKTVLLVTNSDVSQFNSVISACMF